jgi:hypothetical protein
MAVSRLQANTVFEFEQHIVAAKQSMGCKNFKQAADHYERALKLLPTAIKVEVCAGEPAP